MCSLLDVFHQGTGCSAPGFEDGVGFAVYSPAAQLRAQEIVTVMVLKTVVMNGTS